MSTQSSAWYLSFPFLRLTSEVYPDLHQHVTSLPPFFLVLCSSLHSQCSPHLVLCMLNALLHTGLHVLECFVFCFHFCFVVQLFELLGSFLGVLFHSLWKLETSWRLVLLRACARPQGCLWRDLSGTQEEGDKTEWKEKKWGEKKKKKEEQKCGFSFVWREKRRQWAGRSTWAEDPCFSSSLN